MVWYMYDLFEFALPPNWYVGHPFYLCLNPQGSAGDCVGMINVNSSVVNIDRVIQSQRKSFAKYNVNIEKSKVPISDTEGTLLTISGYKKGKEGYERILVFEKYGIIYTIHFGGDYLPVFDTVVNTFQVY